MIHSPITTVCLGKCYSAGSIILAAGTKGQRYALKNSRIMIHGIQCGFPIPGDDIVNSKNYYVGVGSATVDIDKSDKEITKACTLANLAMSGDGNYYLVVGLPISQYKSQHDKFKESILSYNKCEVIYNNVPLRFEIKDVGINYNNFIVEYMRKIKYYSKLFKLIVINYNKC